MICSENTVFGTLLEPQFLEKQYFHYFQYFNLSFSPHRKIPFIFHEINHRRRYLWTQTTWFAVGSPEAIDARRWNGPQSAAWEQLQTDAATPPQTSQNKHRLQQRGGTLCVKWPEMRSLIRALYFFQGKKNCPTMYRDLYYQGETQKDVQFYTNFISNLNN